MYDFSRDLDETGKKNLRDFVESGKGVVVLHHALLNYQKWPWWYEDVVGGSYRLQRRETFRRRPSRTASRSSSRPQGSIRSPRGSGRSRSSTRPTSGCGSRRGSGPC